MDSKKYLFSVWRRKSASAQVKLYEWEWSSTINWKALNDYVSRADLFNILLQPVKLCWLKDKVFFDVKVIWSGESAQVWAIAFAIARALVKKEESYRKLLREAWLLTRDARKVERKKPGLHKARKAMQWSKR